ncbi:lysophospholipid acyltransferase family protein [Zooshikella marina]|uniref:lysophospholipid acyltransferase family protein n=1 Tax=Zooshikella ganghwensis TaxID=202772 RepID=UPI0004011595|nr:lysophospholipid acyltransferase family protein [Zooshikella ganghwensis]MBU2704561.1 lysophospholipid acyltransferase family protein [Zooshikella ganghwensis]
MNHFTIFDTPVLSWFFHWLFKLILRLTGWRFEGQPPQLAKYVLIGAPHTSNWDFFYFIAMAFLYRAKVHWLGKHSLFKGPLGPIMRWLGGIPIDRTQRNNRVQQLVTLFHHSENFILTIAPEGTRSQVSHWKSGFYYIAVGAKVPLQLAYLDFPNKRGGFGPLIWPTGDFERDLLEIQQFFLPFKGKKAP